MNSHDPSREPADDDLFGGMQRESLVEDEVEKAPIWLVSFGDVTALMLTFFVMLFSMSHLQSEKWDAVIALLSTSQTPKDVEKPKPVSDKNIASVTFYNALPVDYLMRILEEKFARDSILSTAPVTGLDGQVIISLPAQAFFDDGSAELLEAGEEPISRLSGVLLQFGNQVDVQAHTTPEPPAAPVDGGTRFQSNWALSLARAKSIALALRNAGYDLRLTVLGLGHSRYRFIDQRLPEPERYRLADRIDIVILPQAGGQ